jgi:hypothetical protein
LSLGIAFVASDLMAASIRAAESLLAMAGGGA